MRCYINFHHLFPARIMADTQEELITFLRCMVCKRKFEVLSRITSQHLIHFYRCSFVDTIKVFKHCSTLKKKKKYCTYSIKKAILFDLKPSLTWIKEKKIFNRYLEKGLAYRYLSRIIFSS